MQVEVRYKGREVNGVSEDVTELKQGRVYEVKSKGELAERKHSVSY